MSDGTVAQGSHRKAPSLPGLREARGRMTRLSGVALLLCMGLGTAHADDDGRLPGPGDHRFTLQHAGKARLYRVHVPKGFSPDRPMPVVFALHGGGGNMDIQADDHFYGQVSKADQAGYIAVFPNGSSRFRGGKLATWNAGRCCGHARDDNADDVGFIREIVERLRAQPGVDASRFYVNGMSNGAMMAYRLACELPGTFRAIAAVAGTDNTSTCTPASPVSVLHIHAKDDPLERFEGGAGRKRQAVTDFVAVPDSVAKWVAIDGCRPEPKRVFEREGAYCEAYDGCRGGSEVKLCVTPSGGHSWPGGAKPRGGGQGSTAFSATDLIWDFFSRH
jgi:polyhydroxybutyrate depolymerase